MPALPIRGIVPRPGLPRKRLATWLEWGSTDRGLRRLPAGLACSRNSTSRAAHWASPLQAGRCSTRPSSPCGVGCSSAEMLPRHALSPPELPQGEGDVQAGDPDQFGGGGVTVVEPGAEDAAQQRVWEVAGCCGVGGPCRSVPIASTPPSATIIIAAVGRSTRAPHAAAPTPRTARPAFSGYRWPRDVILTAVRWYLAYPLSSRQVLELLAERGIDVSHRTVLDWVQAFGPQPRGAVPRARPASAPRRCRRAGVLGTR